MLIMRKLVDFTRRPSMGVAVIVAFAVLAPFIRFEVNDDIQMLTAASGSTTGGTGVPQLMFVSSVLGRLLVLLYAWTRSVEWYGILMAGFSLAAVLGLGHVFLAATDCQGVRERKIAIAGMIAVLSGTVLTMQYTRVGIILAVAGTLLVACPPISGLTRSTDGRVAVLGGALLIVLAFMCRFEAAALGLLLATPAAVLLLRHRGEWRCAVRRAIGAALIAGPLVFGHAWIDQRAYATPEWAEGLRYFYAVRPFADYHLHRKVCATEECAQRSGVWTVNDIELLDDFIYADPVVYSESNLKAVGASLFPQGTSAAWRLATRLRPLTRVLYIGVDDAASTTVSSDRGDHLESGGAVSSTEASANKGPDTSQAAVPILLRIFEGAFAHPEFALFCFMLALALQLASRYRRRAILGYVAWIGLLLAAMYLFTKSPPHWVIRPFWLACAAVLLVAILRDMSDKAVTPRARRLGAAVLIGLSLYVMVTGMRGVLRAVAYERSRDEFQTARHLTDAVLVTSLASFPMESLWRPFGGNRSVHAHRWLLLGWMSGTPVQAAQLHDTGISRPLIAAACGEQAVFLGSEYHARRLETFVWENGGGPCRLSVTSSIGRSAIWHGDRVK